MLPEGVGEVNRESIRSRLTVAPTGGSIHDRMPFAYFQRLTRRQQGIYLRSEKITQVVLPGAAALRPLVAELEIGRASCRERV